MPFQTAHERFLRDKIAESEREVAELDEQKAAEERRFADFRAEHEARMLEHDRTLRTISAGLMAFQTALDNFLATRPEPRTTNRTSGRRGGRGVSVKWQQQYAKLPMAPAQGMTSEEFWRLVSEDRQGISRGAVRSQLSTAKKAGRLENPDGRWRRVAATVAVNGDAEEIEASDDTGVAHRPSEASNGAGAWTAPGTTLLERR